MRRVSRVQTADGVLHEDERAALRHAERRYGDALSRVAHQIVHLDWKYTTTMEFIDTNLNAFVELKALKDDITLEAE